MHRDVGKRKGTGRAELVEARAVRQCCFSCYGFQCPLPTDDSHLFGHKFFDAPPGEREGLFAFFLNLGWPIEQE